MSGCPGLLGSGLPTEADRLRALQWLAVEPSNQAAWRRGKKSAYGAPADWTHMRLTGPNGSIDIQSDVWTSLRGFIIGRPGTPQIYGLNVEGFDELRRLTTVADATSTNRATPPLDTTQASAVATGTSPHPKT